MKFHSKENLHFIKDEAFKESISLFSEEKFNFMNENVTKYNLSQNNDFFLLFEENLPYEEYYICRRFEFFDRPASLRIERGLDIFYETDYQEKIRFIYNRTFFPREFSDESEYLYEYIPFEDMNLKIMIFFKCFDRSMNFFICEKVKNY